MARKKNIAAGLDAVIYARYSSHNQREVSIEQQIAECTKHAAALGLRIVGTYEDRAISGKTDNRPRFQQMMRDAEKGKFQAVVAWKSNRIGRNMLQAMVNEAKLDDYGVKVFYAEEDFDDTAAGRFALRNMMNVNQFYSENMAEDITRGLYDNASKCMANGRQPLGYKRGEDGRVVLDEANAAVVREIFTRVAAGDLFVDIARDLNAQGIKTSKGANWNKGSFQSICQNERYRGIYIYGDVRVADGIPRIVSDDLWYRVQEAMRMKKNPVGTRHRVGAEDYLLTGKLRCGHCGSYMTGVSGTSRNGELHYYYTCQKRRTEHACDKKNIRRDVIEPAVAQAIKMYCLTDDVIAWIADRTVEYWEKHDNDLQIEALEQQLEENKKATSNMLKAIEMGIITEATRTRMVELETEQSRLSVQLNAAKEDVVKIDREQIISYLELLQQGDIHDRDFQMELFKNFLVAVYVYDGNRMKLVFSCMGDQNSVEIPLETGEDPPDGGLSPDAKMFVLTPDSSTKKALYFAGSTVLFFLLRPRGLHCFACTVFGPVTPRKNMLPPEQTGQSKASESSGGSISHFMIRSGVGAEILHPCVIPGGQQMVAVRLGVFGDQVAILVGQHLPEVQEGAALFQCDGREGVVDLTQALFVEAGGLLVHFRPDGGDGLDVDLRIGQRLRDHVQHQPVVGEEAGIVVVGGEHIGAQQDVERPGLLGGQRLHRDLLFAVGPAAGGVVDDGVGADALVGAEMGVGQAGVVQLHPLRQAVAQEADIRKAAPLHGGAGGLGCKAEIHRGHAVVEGLDVEAAGRSVADGVPLAAGQLLLQDGGALLGGIGGRLTVETLPEDAHSGQKHQKDEQRGGDEHPAPAPVKDAAAIFLIICHNVLLWRNDSFHPYYTAPLRPVQPVRKNSHIQGACPCVSYYKYDILK